MRILRNPTGKKRWELIRTKEVSRKESKNKRVITTTTVELLTHELECGHWIGDYYLSKRKDGRHHCLECSYPS